MIVRDFQSVTGQEARGQILRLEGRLLDYPAACVGGGDAFRLLAPLEGVIPALEPAHAVAYLETGAVDGSRPGGHRLPVRPGRQGRGIRQQAAGGGTALNAIDSTFDTLRSQRSKALVCYLTVGFPNLGSTVELAAEAGHRGADIIELGVPFSDPTADRPIIQWMSRAALECGVRPRSVFEMARRVREHARVPVVLLTYYNPVLQYGLDRFVGECVSNLSEGFPDFA